MYFIHSAYYFVDRDGKWHPLGRNRVRALAKYGELTEAPGSLLRMGSLMDRYMKEVAPKKAPRTYKNNLYEVRTLRAVFGRMCPEEVTPQDIYAYMDARNAPVAANREKALLSHIFSYGIRWGVLTNNPCRNVARTPEEARDRYVEDWEYEAVWKLAPQAIQCAMDLACITGLRMGDIIYLNIRDNIRNDGLYVEARKRQKNKKKKKLLFEWTPELRGVVDRCKTLRGKITSLYLICNRQGQRYTEDAFKSLWQRVIRQAVKKRAISERFTFHDLRAKAGSDAENPTELLDHDDPRTTNRVYRRKLRRVTPTRPKIFDNR